MNIARLIKRNLTLTVVVALFCFLVWVPTILFDFNTDIYYPTVITYVSLGLSIYLMVTQAIENYRIRDFLTRYKNVLLFLYFVVFITMISLTVYMTLRLLGIESPEARAFASYMGRIGMLAVLIILALLRYIARRKRP